MSGVREDLYNEHVPTTAWLAQAAADRSESMAVVREDSKGETRLFRVSVTEVDTSEVNES